jgi:heat shock protein beta
LTTWLSEQLSKEVEKVIVSTRLSADTPCVLATSKYGWSANMERIMKAQAMGDNKAMEYMKGKKVMEINPKNSLIKALKAQVAAKASDPNALLTARVIYETSLLTSGFSIESPADFASRVFQVMTASASSIPDNSAPPSTSAPSSGAVDADEVVTPSSDDPWKQ